MTSIAFWASLERESGKRKKLGSNTMPYQVLITSTPRDRDLAENLAESVGETGANVLSVVQTLASEEAINSGLRRTIKKSDEVVFIITERSLDNPYLLLELGAAFSLRKRLIPILVGVEDSEIPPLIAQFPYVRYSELRRYLAELEQRAKSMAGNSPMAAAR
jgi:TIR domain-containing protein